MSRRRVVGPASHHPRYVVWELTLKCDLACRHCGSRAGRARAEELSLAECRDLVTQLADMGTQEITFIGGEAYLHPDWLAIIEATAQAGIRATMTTGARRLTAAVAQQAADAGLQAASVSIDGLQSTHDHLRAVPGSWHAAIAALQHIADAGMSPCTNTQINQLNFEELEALWAILKQAGVSAWQVQLTGPMGRAADQPEWLLQPWQMLELMPRLGAMAKEAAGLGVLIHAANNLGYFGPHETDLRAEPFGSCGAGRYVLGIESNGDIKGCPSLPSAPYVGGNVREAPLAEIWNQRAELAFARNRTRDDLWGFCKGCYYADVCKGGCSWTSHTLLGRPGNMPYCHHRALELKQAGRRERLVREQAAPGNPFDFGRFALIEEAWE
jgi:radical SAM protein with 4Fe4S-binding SPASM domain